MSLLKTSFAFLSLRELRLEKFPFKSPLLTGIFNSKKKPNEHIIYYAFGEKQMVGGFNRMCS